MIEGLKMTINEAIKKCNEEATRQESIANSAKNLDVSHESIVHCKRCATEYRQLAKWLKELKEAKRLLKAAIEDLNATAAEVYNGGVICGCCKWESQIGKCSCPNNGGCDTDYQWRYADEALKLIGDEPSK